MKELSIGPLTLVGEFAGAHVHVTVLGAGQPGQRPHCGRITVSADEWTGLAQIAELRAELALFDPIRSLIGDWCWPGIANETPRLSPLWFAAETLTKVEGAIEAFEKRKKEFSR